jgi:hypothetical protein
MENRVNSGALFTNEVKKEMTPKEKAQQLSKIFIDIETAIIWVDSELNGSNLKLGLEPTKEFLEDKPYWVQVKNELEKLKQKVK